VPPCRRRHPDLQTRRLARNPLPGNRPGPSSPSSRTGPPRRASSSACCWPWRSGALARSRSFFVLRSLVPRDDTPRRPRIQRDPTKPHALRRTRRWTEERTIRSCSSHVCGQLPMPRPRPEEKVLSVPPPDSRVRHTHLVPTKRPRAPRRADRNASNWTISSNSQNPK